MLDLSSSYVLTPHAVDIVPLGATRGLTLTRIQRDRPYILDMHMAYSSLSFLTTPGDFRPVLGHQLAEARSLSGEKINYRSLELFLAKIAATSVGRISDDFRRGINRR